MRLFTNVLNTIKNAADSAYHYVLPRSASEYAGAGLEAAGRLVEDLVGDGLSGVEVAFRAVASGIPAGLKSCSNAGKAVFWDLPKAAYYKYYQNDAEINLALQQASEDFAGAGNRMIEAVSTSAGVAYEGFKPLLKHAGTSIFYNGGEAVLDVGAVASIALIEGGKLAGDYISPVATRLAEAALALETMAIQQASNAYDALPSVRGLLPGFTVEMSQNSKPLLSVSKGADVERTGMSVIKGVHQAIAAAVA